MINKISFLLVLCLLGFAQAGYGVKNVFDNSFRAAMYGPAMKDEKIWGHDFSVFEGVVDQKPDHMEYEGWINHEKFFGPDRVYFKVYFRPNSAIRRIRVNRDGTWRDFPGYLRSIMGSYYGTNPVRSQDIKPLTIKISKARPSPVWENAVEMLIAQIAIRISPLAHGTFQRRFDLTMWAGFAGPKYRTNLYNQEMTVYKMNRAGLGGGYRYSSKVHHRAENYYYLHFKIDTNAGVLQNIQIGAAKSGQTPVYRDLDRDLLQILEPYIRNRKVHSSETNYITNLIHAAQASPEEKVIAQYAIRVR